MNTKNHLTHLADLRGKATDGKWFATDDGEIYGEEEVIHLDKDDAAFVSACANTPFNEIADYVSRLEDAVRDLADCAETYMQIYAYGNPDHECVRTALEKHANVIKELSK